MTASGATARPTAICPVCFTRRALTGQGRLWIHGPPGRRCRGSRLQPWQARDVARLSRALQDVPTGGLL